MSAMIIILMMTNACSEIRDHFATPRTRLPCSLNKQIMFVAYSNAEAMVMISETFDSNRFVGCIWHSES